MKEIKQTEFVNRLYERLAKLEKERQTIISELNEEHRKNPMRCPDCGRIEVMGDNGFCYCDCIEDMG